MNTKFEFVDGDTIEFNGTTLRRIRALRDIPAFNVKTGDLGGYLAEESSLSQDNNSWIEKNAWIGQGVTIPTAAEVYKEATINPTVLLGFSTEGWNITITDNHMKIGCQTHSFEEGENFTDASILQMAGKTALRFCRENKAILMALCQRQAKILAEKASAK